MRKQPAPSADPVALAYTIQHIDSLCGEALGRIAAVARMARLAAERPGDDEADNIAQVLGLIEDLAAALDSGVNSAAGQVGCNFKEDRHASV